MSEEWSDWFLHDGKGCPCVGAYVHVKGKSGREAFGIAGAGYGPCTQAGLPWDACWTWHIFADPIIRYRIRKPRGLTILENLIADLPAPVGPKVDA